MLGHGMSWVMSWKKPWKNPSKTIKNHGKIIKNRSLRRSSIFFSCCSLRLSRRSKRLWRSWRWRGVCRVCRSKPSEIHWKSIGKWWLNGIEWDVYPLVMANITVENGYRNNGFSHEIWSFSIVMLIYERVIIPLNPSKPSFSYGFPMVSMGVYQKWWIFCETSPGSIGWTMLMALLVWIHKKGEQYCEVSSVYHT